ncbi:MAG: molybdenum cofactor guanylyltransferase [Candidatus Odinarchaeota archaeon]
MLNINKSSKYLAFSILIGGKSTRFGSDKGLFQILEKPLISYELETLGKINYDIFLVANSTNQVQNYIEKIDLKKITAFIIDEQPLFKNKFVRAPIIGLYSVFKELKRLRYKKVLVTSCDIPLVKKKLVEYLIEQSEGYDCCIPQWNNGFLEPLLAIYPVEKALKTAKRNIINESYKLINLISNKWRINFISIEKSLKQFDENLDSFTNINELKDIEKIKKIIQNSSSL